MKQDKTNPRIRGRQSPRVDLQSDVTIELDANTLVAGDQAFALRGTSGFSGKAGELIWSHGTDAAGNGTTLLMADTNGDMLVDMAVRFEGVHAFTASDFML